MSVELARRYGVLIEGAVSAKVRWKKHRSVDCIIVEVLFRTGQDLADEVSISYEWFFFSSTRETHIIFLIVLKRRVLKRSRCAEVIGEIDLRLALHCVPSRKVRTIGVCECLDILVLAVNKVGSKC